VGARAVDHPLVSVHANDDTAGTDRFGDPFCDRAGSASDVEHGHARNEEPGERAMVRRQTSTIEDAWIRLMLLVTHR
jgi:hypothetical protein